MLVWQAAFESKRKEREKRKKEKEIKSPLRFPSTPPEERRKRCRNRAPTQRVYRNYGTRNKNKQCTFLGAHYPVCPFCAPDVRTKETLQICHKSRKILHGLATRHVFVCWTEDLLHFIPILRNLRDARRRRPFMPMAFRILSRSPSSSSSTWGGRCRRPVVFLTEF
jgi:hypothetical protein